MAPPRRYGGIGKVLPSFGSFGSFGSNALIVRALKQLLFFSQLFSFICRGPGLPPSRRILFFFYTATAAGILSNPQNWSSRHNGVGKAEQCSYSCFVFSVVLTR